jgi:tungstate transport system ATP-binding protein
VATADDLRSPRAHPVAAPVLTMVDTVVRVNGQPILDVDEFKVAAGESVALIGPNGAGKTTLLHVAALLRRPDAGAVTILGQFATAENAPILRRQLSVVFQDPLLFDTGVIENAAAGLRFAGVPRADAERRARGWLARFGVGHLSQRRARSLSGGEAGRVALARAFATEPALLLLDEPFAALDGPTRAALLPELRARLRETGAAAVLVTHDLDEAFAFGDRIVVLDRGRIAASGPPADLVARPPSGEVATLLGVENIHPAVVRDVQGGCAWVDLLPHGPTLHAAIPAGTSLPRGERVTVTFPASAAQVIDPDAAKLSGWNALPGEVVAVTALPSGTRVVVHTPAPIVAFAPWRPPRSGWRVGEMAVAALPPEAVHIIREIA